MANAYSERDSILKRMGYADYLTYLKGSLWAGIRLRVFKKRGRKCRGCGKKADQIHHRSYSEPVLSGCDLKPLVPICDGCHDRIEFDGQSKVGLDEANRRLDRLIGSHGVTVVRVKRPPKIKSVAQATKKRLVQIVAKVREKPVQCKVIPTKDCHICVVCRKNPHRKREASKTCGRCIEERRAAAAAARQATNIISVPKHSLLMNLSFNSQGQPITILATHRTRRR